MTRAALVFVESPQAKPVVLHLDVFNGTRVDAAIAPDPPPVGEDTNLSVRVSDRVVDNQGVVRTTPRPGVTVTLSGSGSWAVRSSNPGVTDGTGTVMFRLVCRAEGSQALSVVLDGTEVQPLNLPPCSVPATTTTTTTTSASTSTTTTTTTTRR
jgi:hypothetical protein